MKVLCVEDGSVDIDALENGELRDGKVLVYRQGSKPPFVLEIPNNNKSRLLKELEEIKAMLKADFQNDTYLNVYKAIERYYCYIDERVKIIKDELKENIDEQLTHQHEDKVGQN